ncbi:MAG: hypothetical protein ACKOUM_04550, partial [Sphingopyxis sp.]
MNRTALLKIAAAGVVAAIGLGAPSAVVMAGNGDAPAANPNRAARSADRAESMLSRGKAERALRFAEEAVAFAPSDAGYRSILGQAYMANGRFVSAEASFDAARQLGAVDSRTIIGHALALIATGRASDALALVDANAQTLPASDYGLALALGGQAERGAMVLTDVVRAGDSTARDRQNLALSYALAGRWLEAQLIAAQDLGAAAAQDRITEWATLTQAADPRQRIASLVGSTPVEDAGMPVRLALMNGRPQAVALASNTDPAPLALYAPAPASNSAEIVDQMLDDTQAAEPVADTAAAYAQNDVAAPAAPAAFDTPSYDATAATPVESASASASAGGVTFVSNPVIQQIRSVVAMVAPLASPRRAAPARTPRPARAAAPRTVAAATA